MKRSFALLVVLCLLSSLFSACSPASPDAAEPEASQAPSAAAAASSVEEPAGEGAQNTGLSEDVTLRVVWWGSQDRHDRTLTVVDMFMELYPNIGIETEYLGFGPYEEKLASQAAAGNLPDVLQTDYNYIEPYSDRGLIIPLDEFIPDYLNLDDCDPAALDGGRIDGKLYGVNLGSGAPTIIYDPAMFESAGLELPDPTWTYEDYEAAMQTIHDTHGTYGATELYDAGPFRGLEIYTRQHGQTFYTADGKSLGFTEDVFIKFFEMHKRFATNGLLPMPDVMAEAISNVEADLVVSSKSAITTRNSNQTVSMQKAANRELRMTTVPVLEGQTQYGGYIKASMLFSISRDCENPKYGAKFIDYFTNDIEANKVLSAERGVPVSKKVQEGIAPFMSETVMMTFEYINTLSQYSSPIDPPQPAANPEVGTLLSTLETEIMYDEKTIEDAATEFFQKANDILSK